MLASLRNKLHVAHSRTGLMYTVELLEFYVLAYMTVSQILTGLTLEVMVTSNPLNGPDTAVVTMHIENDCRASTLYISVMQQSSTIPVPHLLSSPLLQNEHAFQRLLSPSKYNIHVRIQIPTRKNGLLQIPPRLPRRSRSPAHRNPSRHSRSQRLRLAREQRRHRSLPLRILDKPLLRQNPPGGPQLDTHRARDQGRGERSWRRNGVEMGGSGRGFV